MPMQSYRVMVQGVFVRPAELEAGLFGFFTTFYVNAINHGNARVKIARLLAERMANHSILSSTAGALRSYYLVAAVWETTDDVYFENDQRDKGFTFFPIGRIERYWLSCRHFLIRQFHGARLIEPTLGVGRIQPS